MVKICICFDVDQEELVKTIREKGIKTLNKLCNETNAGNGCGRCRNSIQKILDAELNQGISNDESP